MFGTMRHRALRMSELDNRQNRAPRAKLAFEPLEQRALLAATLPAGFTDTTVTTGINGPTAMEFSPDGRLWVLEQSGKVNLIRADGTKFTALSKTVDGNGERGMLGIAFDPNFATNHYVYLYYTNPNAGTAAWSGGTHNQLSRFTVNDTNPQQPTFTNEAPILDWNKLSSATNHNGGAIHFGADGMLYANAGDNVQTFTGPNGASYRVSQSLDTLLGKQLRIDVAKFNSGVATRNDTTVGHLIPANNPFVGQATGINQLIYVMGLRNPFTFAVQPGTGKILINDVGETSFEEINLAVAGANFGWSGGATDGFGHAPPSFAAGTYKDPLLAYAHSGSGSLATGAAVVGGTFYNPATVQFPSSYVGMYFYEDLASGWIRYFNPNNPNSSAKPDGNSVAFATNTPGALRDLKVDSVGNLYYLSGGDKSIHKISYQIPTITTQPADKTVAQGQAATFTVAATGPGLSYQWQHLVGTTWTNLGGNSNTLTVNNVQSSSAGGYRVLVSNTFGTTTSRTATLTVNVANTAPTITMQPTNQQAGVGGAVTFSVTATGSTPITYQWQHQVSGAWKNVGTNSTTLTINPVAIADGGNYRVLATNSIGTATSNTVSLTINQLPTVTIASPTASTMYNWGQTINFAGSATDPEDGTLPASKLNWQIQFFHEDLDDGTGLHFHPFQTFTGVASGSIVTNFPETAPHVWYRFTLTATDSKGGTASNSVDIHPNIQSFVLQTNVAGLQLMLDGGAIASGSTITGTVGQPRQIGVVSPQIVGGVTYVFTSWSDGGAAAHTINIPTTKTTYTANFTAQPSSTYHLEAETFALTNYAIETNSSASGGKVISVKNNPGVAGVATTTFKGPSGQYRVVAGVYDENDGASPMSVQFGTAAPINFTLNANLPGADANAATKTTRDLGIVQISSGQTIKLGGQADVGEFARWDYLDLIPVTQALAITKQPVSQSTTIGGTASFSVTATGTAPIKYQWQKQVSGNWSNVGTNSAKLTFNSVAATDAGNYRVVVSNSQGTATSNTVGLAVGASAASFRFEAEDLTLKNYLIENNSSASGGKIISLKNVGSLQGGATVTFNGPSGSYRAIAGVYDENDGVSTMSVQFGTTAPIVFKLNATTGDADSTAKSRVARDLGIVQLSKGQTIQLAGLVDGGEFARWDYLDLIPATQAAAAAASLASADAVPTDDSSSAALRSSDRAGLVDRALLSLAQNLRNSVSAGSTEAASSIAESAAAVRLASLQSQAAALVERVQNVSLNGNKLIANSDIFGELGKRLAVVRKLDSVSESGLFDAALEKLLEPAEDRS